MSHLVRFFEAANMTALRRRRQMSWGMAARHLRWPVLSPQPLFWDGLRQLPQMHQAASQARRAAA